jgi:hypothetical protein
MLMKYVIKKMYHSSKKTNASIHVFFLKHLTWRYGLVIETEDSTELRVTKHFTHSGRGLVQMQDSPGSQLIPNLASSCATELQVLGIRMISLQIKCS